MTAILLGFCVLSGKWHFLIYMAAGVALFLVVLLYALYLEYNAQEELERQRKEQVRDQLRFGRKRI